MGIASARRAASGGLGVAGSASGVARRGGLKCGVILDR